MGDQQVYQDLFPQTIKAAEALEAARFIKADGKYADAGELVFGVTRSKVAKDALVTHDPLGIRWVEKTNAAIALHDEVAAAADGKAIKLADGNKRAGFALKAAAAADKFVQIFIAR